MDDTSRLIVFGGPAPLLVAIIGVVAGLFGTWRDETRDPTGWRLPLTFGIAFLVSFLGINGLPESNLDVAAMTIVAMSILGTFSQASRRPVLCGSVAIVVLALMIQWNLHREAWWLRLAPIAHGALLFTLLEAIARRTRPAPLALGLGASCGMAALGSILVGMHSFGVPCASVGIVLGVIGIAGLFSPRMRLDRGTLLPCIPVVSVVPAIAWSYVVAYGETFPWYAMAGPAVAPFLFVACLFGGRPIAWVTSILVGAISAGSLAPVLVGSSASSDEEDWESLYGG